VTPLTTAELIAFQLELECVGLDADQRLYRLECEDPDDLPLFYVAKHADQYITYFGRDVDPAVVEQLRAMPPEKAFHDMGAVQRILYPKRGARPLIWKGITYHFETLPPPESYPDVQQQENAFVVIDKGVAVASAWSERLSAHAAEIAVDTVPQLRYRGLGKQVALAWGAHQIKENRVGFYSHHVDNKASAALAKNLGVVPVMEVVVYA